MRLMFYRPSSAHYQPESPVPFQTGVPVSSASSLEAPNGAFSLVGNPGNMIHRMAMVQTLEFDRARSSAVNVLKLGAQMGAEGAATVINNNFDAAILTFSNIVNVKADEGMLADVLEKVDIPIFAAGIGIQDAAAPDLATLNPTISKLLTVLDRKARLFGVRGNATKKWLNDAGLKKPIAIGCPSLFVYPRNIDALRPPRQVNRIMAAGHLGAVNLRPDGNARGRKLMEGFLNNSGADLEIGYVFQGEVRNYPSVKDAPLIYNEATSTFDHAAVNGDVERISQMTSPFTRYYSFGDVGSWRQACLQYDVFVGDRIHGAVAAMQAGVPALVIHHDDRVLELATFHGIPRCSLDEFAKIGVRAAIDKHLSDDAFVRFGERYAIVLKKFADSLKKSGLRLAIEAEIQDVLSRGGKRD